MEDKYCYGNSVTLINKFGIKDINELKNISYKIVSNKMENLENNIYYVKGDLDFKHFKNINKYLFEDLYDWAGNVRTCAIAKEVIFCLPECIYTYADSIFNNLKNEEYFSGYNYMDKIYLLSKLYSDINALHPFREGNGRTNNSFLKVLSKVNGIDINFKEIDRKELLNANKKGFSCEFEEINKLLFKYSEIYEKELKNSYINNVINDKDVKKLLLKR